MWWMTAECTNWPVKFFLIISVIIIYKRLDNKKNLVLLISSLFAFSILIIHLINEQNVLLRSIFNILRFFLSFQNNKVNWWHWLSQLTVWDTCSEKLMQNQNLKPNVNQKLTFNAFIGWCWNIEMDQQWLAFFITLYCQLPSSFQCYQFKINLIKFW